MPHDKNGVELHRGDKVLVEMTVHEVYPGAETCEVSLRREVEGEQKLWLSCQAKQLEKLHEPETVSDGDRAEEPAADPV